jgi:hypothetical protein
MLSCVFRMRSYNLVLLLLERILQAIIGKSFLIRALRLANASKKDEKSTTLSKVKSAFKAPVSHLS